MSSEVPLDVASLRHCPSIGAALICEAATGSIGTLSAHFRHTRCDWLTMVTRTLSLTGIYEPIEDGSVQATIEELPGVITAAETYEKAREMLLDALREYLLAGGDASEVAESARREPLHISLSA
jgi:predicted RNase H-like HicB family nuclease